MAFQALAAWENGQLQLSWGHDPPAVIIEAVQLLNGALAAARGWEDDEREKRRKAVTP